MDEEPAEIVNDKVGKITPTEVKPEESVPAEISESAIISRQNTEESIVERLLREMAEISDDDSIDDADLADDDAESDED